MSERKQYEMLLNLLKLIHDDLLMRAEIDDDGRKIVNISGFIWVKIKKALIYGQGNGGDA